MLACPCDCVYRQPLGAYSVVVMTISMPHPSSIFSISSSSSITLEQSFDQSKKFTFETNLHIFPGLSRIKKFHHEDIQHHRSFNALRHGCGHSLGMSSSVHCFQSFRVQGLIIDHRLVTRNWRRVSPCICSAPDVLRMAAPAPATTIVASVYFAMVEEL